MWRDKYEERIEERMQTFEEHELELKLNLWSW